MLGGITNFLVTIMWLLNLAILPYNSQSPIGFNNRTAISGTVVDEKIQPIKNVNIEFVLEGKVLKKTKTDANGSFTLSISLVDKGKIRFLKKSFANTFIEIQNPYNSVKPSNGISLPEKLKIYRKDNFEVNHLAFKQAAYQVHFVASRDQWRVKPNSNYFGKLNALVSIKSFVRANYKLNILNKPFKDLQAFEKEAFKDISAHSLYQELVEKKNQADESSKASAQFNIDALNMGFKNEKKTAILRKEAGVPAKVTLLSEDGTKIYSKRTNAEGGFEMFVQPNTHCTLLIEASGYRDVFLDLDLANESPNGRSSVTLNQIKMYFTTNQNLNDAAFKVPYASLNKDNSTGRFKITPNPAFRSLLASNVASVGIAPEVLSPEGKKLSKFSIKVYSMDNEFLKKVEFTKKRTALKLAQNEYYLVYSDSKHWSKVFVDLREVTWKKGQKPIPVAIRLFEKKRMIKIKMANVTTSRYNRNRSTQKIEEDVDYWKRVFTAYMNGNGLAINNLANSIGKKNKNRPKIAYSPTKLIEAVKTNKIRKINKAKEERSQFVYEERNDLERASKSIANRKRLQAVYYSPKPLQMVSKLNFVPFVTVNRNEMSHGFYSRITKVRIGYDSSVYYIEETNWLFFKKYYKGMEPISDEQFFRSVGS